MKPKNSSSIQFTTARPSERVRVIVVDDEALARRALVRALVQDAAVEVAAECSLGREAIDVIRQQHPDVVFLDIEMPGISGMDVAREVEGMPDLHIVFVTAYEQYAIDAFHVHAFDYVVKPIDEEKIQKVMERVKAQVRQTQLQTLDGKLSSLFHLMEKQNDETSRYESAGRISIRNRGRIYFIDPNAVEWVESDGNYALLHVGAAKHIVRSTMNELEQKLSPQTFFRIHRSMLVNVHAVKELRPFFNGAFEIQLQNGQKIFSSRGYRKNVEKIFQDQL